jgi:hypothetical protein
MYFPAQFVSPRSARLVSATKTQVSPTHSGAQRPSSNGMQQRFAIELTTPPLLYAEAMHLFSFIVGLDGQFKACSLANPLPQIGNGLGDQAVLRSAAEQGKQVISVTDGAASVLSALMPGDFVQFANHSKAYMVTNVANTNGLGQSTFTVTPSLRKAVPAGTLIRSGQNVVFNMALQSDEQDILLSAQSDRRTSFVIEFQERHYD